MLFWGWGRRNLRRPLGPNQAVVLTYRYFHLMFVFTAAWGYHYSLSTATEYGWANRPITPDEAGQLLGGQPLLPNLWVRFSIFLLLGLVLIVVAIAAIGHA